MPIPHIVPDISVEVTTATFEEWPIKCEHSMHGTLARGHADGVPILAVAGLTLTCCGAIPPPSFLCSTWVATKPLLRCTDCGADGFPFDDCYVILGPV